MAGNTEIRVGSELEFPLQYFGKLELPAGAASYKIETRDGKTVEFVGVSTSTISLDGETLVQIRVLALIQSGT